MKSHRISRRRFCTANAAAGAATFASGLLQRQAVAEEATPFTLRYMLATCMYGYQTLGEILPEANETGANAIDLWPKVHGNQREQLDDLGEEKFAAMLKKHNVSLGCVTRYDIGPFGLQDEMRLAARLGCQSIVTGGKGPKSLTGADLKKQVKIFVEKLKPHLAVAEETGVTLAIENHGNNLIESPDSLKWLAELRPSKHLAIALAPYHLPQSEQSLAELIRTLGDSIALFYAWQHGMGCMKKLPKEQELQQLPGRGELDFAPIIDALKSIDYTGWTEVFMHPVPRGIPILETTDAVTAEINRARDYLDRLC